MKLELKHIRCYMIYGVSPKIEPVIDRITVKDQFLKAIGLDLKDFVLKQNIKNVSKKLQEF